LHFYRNVSTQVPHTKVREVMAMMKAIHAQESRAEAKKKAAFVELLGALS
jgi:putative transposase